jgi:hypothetical protein
VRNSGAVFLAEDGDDLGKEITEYRKQDSVRLSADDLHHGDDEADVRGRFVAFDRAVGFSDLAERCTGSEVFTEDALICFDACIDYGGFGSVWDDLIKPVGV